MAIEGPLRELGIHDVFQLLDLSRKTGVLRVVSELREDEGLVVFDGGRVVQASIRSKPAPDFGAISQKELERQQRLHVQSVVFELMSWREGFFSFEERSRERMPRDSRISVSTESLLMEGARRIDEWSRIADVVPNAGLVPELAPVDASPDASGGLAETDGETGPMLDLLPHEWQVLTMIDGERDLRGIAASLGRDEFEIAKIAYGLATTGVIQLIAPARTSQEVNLTAIRSHLAVARAHTRAGRHAEAADELRHAMQEDPLTARVHLEFAYAAARIGDFAAARASWEHFLRLSPEGDSANRARDALAALDRFVRVLEDESHG